MTEAVDEYGKTEEQWQEIVTSFLAGLEKRCGIRPRYTRVDDDLLILTFYRRSDNRKGGYAVQKREIDIWGTKKVYERMIDRVFRLLET